MSARRQATPDRPADVGHDDAVTEPAQAQRPSGRAGNGEAAKTPLPTRVPANRRRSPGKSPPAGPPPAAATAPEPPGQVSERAEQTQTQTLSTRLMALSRMVQIGNARGGRDGFSKKLLGQAEDVLGRAGERMRLSSAHTVVALAGGTGSGKSSLFNRLAGADFSTVGVTRPITRDVHACIWDDAGSGALLEWLAVPQRNRYSRASALGGIDPGLAGLVLLDLPDHDSVMSHAGELVDQLVSKNQ